MTILIWFSLAIFYFLGYCTAKLFETKPYNPITQQLLDDAMLMYEYLEVYSSDSAIKLAIENIRKGNIKWSFKSKSGLHYDDLISKAKEWHNLSKRQKMEAKMDIYRNDDYNFYSG